jgi:hypothetical protein
MIRTTNPQTLFQGCSSSTLSRARTVKGSLLASRVGPRRRPLHPNMTSRVSLTQHRIQGSRNLRLPHRRYHGETVPQSRKLPLVRNPRVRPGRAPRLRLCRMLRLGRTLWLGLPLDRNLRLRLGRALPLTRPLSLEWTPPPCRRTLGLSLRRTLRLPRTSPLPRTLSPRTTPPSRLLFFLSHNR